MPMFTVTIQMRSGEDKRGRGRTLREALLTVGTRHPSRRVQKVIITWRSGDSSADQGVGVEGGSLLEALMLFAEESTQWRADHDPY